MRGTTLANLVTMLKAELGDSLSVGNQSDALYKQLLANEQKFLVGERTFPFLETRWPVSTVAGTRVYDFPTTTLEGTPDVPIDFERPLRFEYDWDGRLHELDYGIGSAEYNTYDSFASTPETMDPPQRWRYNGPSQFELWPVPASSRTNGIRITGQRALTALVNDTDTAMLDDELLVLSVATKIMARREKMTSSLQLLLNQARARLNRLLANYPVNHNPIIFGQNQLDDRRQVRTAKLVVVA